MKVSIAMATYNGENYIEEQLFSILNQTRAADEVMIIDDCSKDQTAKIVMEFINKYQLENWKFQVNQSNRGFIGNFFHIIEKTTGDIIFFCDQDDKWERNKIEEMSKLMEHYPNILSLNSAVELIDEKSNPLPLKHKRGYCNANILHKSIKPNALVDFSFDYLVKTNISPGCTMCIRKDLKEKVLRYKEQCVETKFPHDWFCNLIASIEQGTYFWNKTFIGYRMHNNNTIGVNTEHEEDSINIKSTKQLKLGIGEFHYKRACFIEKEIQLKAEHKTYIEKYLTFSKKRYIFLSTLSLKDLLCVYMHPGLYFQSIGVKGMISDLIYGLKLDTLLRKK